MHMTVCQRGLIPTWALPVRPETLDARQEDSKSRYLRTATSASLDASSYRDLLTDPIANVVPMSANSGGKRVVPRIEDAAIAKY